MPDRYHIHPVPLPGRFRRVGKFGSVDWREDCSRCTNCVKPRCLYDAYRQESAHNRDPAAPVQTLNACKACLSCVQGCTKGLLGIAINPEFLELGDAYWKPDILLTTWNQADNGKVPVSGAGYRGRFHGPGFDSIWTDMSEIVRPTRDGIHGREYISTSVDIGSKPMRLEFAADGRMLTAPSNLLEIQLPAILDMPAWEVRGPHLSLARAAAAQELSSLAVLSVADAAALPPERLPFAVPVLRRVDEAKAAELLGAVRMAELHDGPDVTRQAAELRRAFPALIVAVRVPLRPGAADRAVELARGGLKVLHLCADLHGLEHVENGTPGRHLKDTLREVHGRMVKEGLRDEVTLIAGGGIALPEHMAKAIICGADLVAVETPLLVALGCRVCRDARTPSSPCSDTRCPAEIGAADAAYATQRMVNLLGAWHSQLIEVLGAMGIREVRRLRGEVGRAMFLEDIEKDAFGDIAHLSRAPRFDHVPMPVPVPGESR
jgi:hypothetical protein